jgi:peptide/nickel transport system substrate-binding protein
MNPNQVLANEKNGDLGQAWLKDGDAGSGPFRQGRWEHGVLYEFVRVEDYWNGWEHPGKHPHSVIYKLTRESGALKIALQKGGTDFVSDLSPEDFDLVTKLPGIRDENHPGITTFGLKMNCQRSFTKDKNIRKAICYAIDYDGFLRIHNGNAILEDSPVPIGLRGHVTTDAYRQDLEKAKEHMKKAGYPDGGFEVEYLYVQGHPVETKVGLLLIDSLAKIGIKVKMTPMTWPNMTARAQEIETSPELFACYTTPLFNDPDAVVSQYHKDSWGMKYGSHFYENPEVWRLTEQARILAKWEDRAEIYAKIQHMIMDDAPEVFGMQENHRWAFRDYVKGFKFCALRGNNVVDFYNLYIEK